MQFTYWYIYQHADVIDWYQQAEVMNYNFGKTSLSLRSSLTDAQHKCKRVDISEPLRGL